MRHTRQGRATLMMILLIVLFEFALIVLFFGVYYKKDGIISELEAGGILCTEYKIFKNKSIESPYPDYLNDQYVRAAHKYNIAFSHVRENFAIAGLLSEIQVKQSKKTQTHHVSVH